MTVQKPNRAMKAGTRNVRILKPLCADLYHTGSASHLRNKLLSIAVRGSPKLTGLGPPACTLAILYPLLIGDISSAG